MNNLAAELLQQHGGDVEKAIAELRHVAETQRLSARLKRELSPEIIIRASELKKTYKIGKQHVAALAGVSLEVHKGEFLALTGASGSGKSTLLQLLGGLDKPSSGTVEVDGQLLSALSDRRMSEFRNRTIGFIFQFFYLQPFLKLRQNLEVAGVPARTNPSERHKKLEKLAAVVGLSDRLDHFPKELSGGQMQRAAIARSLLNDPQILLADEPTGNLDSQNGAAIIELFEKIRDEFGTTIIIVTHDPMIAARADREVRLKDGVIV